MKKELPEHRRLQAGPASVVVMATCVGKEGRPNIITLGMYMSISSNPPQVCIGVAPQRYSHGLIEETGEFVVNVPSIDLEEAMHFCGVKSGRDLDLGKMTDPGAPRRKVRTVIDGILTSLSNPYWFIWWATIGLVYLGRASRYGWFGVGSFYSGHILADLAWYALISGAVSKGRRFLNDRLYRGVIGVCAGFLVVFAGYFVYSGVNRVIT